MPKGRYYKGKGAKKAMDKENYASLDQQRRQEVQDSMMIREDRTQVANLPQQAIMMEYQKNPYIETPYLDDTVRGVDHQINKDVKESKRKVYPEKY